MTDLEKYKYVLGEIIMLYQFIENDIKLIMAGMLKGDFKENVELIRNKINGLGEAIRELEKLDNSDGNPFFNKAQYDFLKKIAKERNYYCHNCCLEFAYESNVEFSKKFKSSFSKLTQTREDLIAVQNSTEEFRINVLKRYRGI